MKRNFVAHDGRAVAVAVTAGHPGWQCELTDGDQRIVHAVVLERTPGGVVLVSVGGIVRPVRMTVQGSTAWLTSPGHTSRWTHTVARRGKQGHSEAVVRAPMTGRVVVVHVQAGDLVTKGQPLVVVEAMKMEHAMKAPRDAIVARVACVAGQLVDTGQDLLELADRP